MDYFIGAAATDANSASTLSSTKIPPLLPNDTLASPNDVPKFHSSNASALPSVYLKLNPPKASPASPMLPSNDKPSFVTVSY